LILIADNLQITNPVIEKAVADFRAEPIQELVRACQKAGAHMIDINAGPLPRDGDKKMAFHAETVKAAKASDALIGQKPFAWESL
jgi:5-methyltetrahydrofolate corrinoid/iron sulfur protein methyltransferase